MKPQYRLVEQCKLELRIADLLFGWGGGTVFRRHYQIRGCASDVYDIFFRNRQMRGGGGGV